MQIIIEVKNAGVFNRLVELIRRTDWLKGVRVWKKADEQAQTELVLDNTQVAPTPNSRPDYSEFWAIIQPQMGIPAVDKLISEMRED